MAEDFTIEIQGKKLEVRELTIAQSSLFFKFIFSAIGDIDLQKMQNPLELLERVADLATQRFDEFALAVFAGQDIKGIKFDQVKLSEAIRIINFFLRCNGESVKELQDLLTNSISMIGAEKAQKSSENTP